MKIGIAGYGFVGQAHEALLKGNHEIIINDPYKGYHKDLHYDVECIIIAVSTPSNPDGSCYMDNIYDVIKSTPDVPLLIKSTISLEGWKELMKRFPDRDISFSPEFLREASAFKDLQNMKTLLITRNSFDFWKGVFDFGGALDIIGGEPEELILTKYFRNSFLATKVAFFNQVYDLCEATDIDYSSVAKYIGIDSRIGDSHTNVTSKRGFGGHCFPKDTKAIVETAKLNNIKLSIIEDAIDYNTKIRREN
jgi:UDPglucose 6-dehydrogenase